DVVGSCLLAGVRGPRAGRVAAMNGGGGFGRCSSRLEEVVQGSVGVGGRERSSGPEKAGWRLRTIAPKHSTDRVRPRSPASGGARRITRRSRAPGRVPRRAAGR